MQMPSARRWIGSPSPIGVAAAMAIAAPLVLAACDIGVGPDTVSTEAAAITHDQQLLELVGQRTRRSATPARSIRATPSSRAWAPTAAPASPATTPRPAWSITPASVQAKFNASNGTDPIFRLNDGANAPNLPVSTVAQRQTAYSMLLNRGVIRVGLPIPANAEFDLVAVDDPYGYASAKELSLFRRPLPTTNLSFLSARHVGRARDRRRRDHGAEPGASGQRRDPRPRAGVGAADRRAAELDRRVRDRALHRADQRQRRRQPVGVAGDRRPGVPVEAGVLHRHQRSAGRQPAGHRVHQRRVLALQRLDELRRQRHGVAARRRRSRAARTSSTTTRSASRASAGSTTSWASPRSTAPARPATTRPTSATTRCRCRSTSV